MQTFDSTVIVFDLDDTLYKEIDYVKSGIEAVLQLLSATNILSQSDVDTFAKNVDLKSGVIDQLCHQFDFDAKLKETLIWCYRLHVPLIKLETETSAVLAWAEEFSKAVAVITDGRSITQRLKLRALGLSHLWAFVSEEHQNGKPDPAMFLKVEETWPDCNYVYVADNVLKDFLAPNRLAWSTIGLRDDGRNIERAKLLGSAVNPNAYEPDVWISSLSELQDSIFNAQKEDSKMPVKGVN
jgi:putative hydrolase of the HAD superfamily